MNKLEEIQELIKKFIYEKQQTKQEIVAIEEKRNVLAQERNHKINENNGEAYTEKVQARIFELGNQIKELGNQSQELQNKLDKKFIDIKNEIRFEIDKNIASIMPGIKEKEEKKLVVQKCMEEKENRDARYTKQKEEFYKRFGRMPVLSESAMKENEIQEEEYKKNRLLIEQLNNEVKVQEEEISKLVKIANDFKKGNWNEYIKKDIEQEKNADGYKYEIIDSYVQKIAEEVINPIVESVIEQNITSETKEEDSIVLPLTEEDSIEQINADNIENTYNIEIPPKVEIEEIQPLEEIYIEEIESFEEINVDENKSINEINVEEINIADEVELEELKPIEEISLEELKPIEETTQIIQAVEEGKEEITYENFSDQEIESQQERTLEELLNEEEKKQQEQAQSINSNQTHNTCDENDNVDNEIQKKIITYERQEDSNKTQTYFGEKVNLLNINAKIEDGEVVYKAQTSNGDCIKLYPRKVQAGNILMKDKENREELKEILINYAIAEYRMLDKKVVKKIDPSICEILIRFAKKYNYDAQSLIYNYAMSFSKNDESEIENMPIITYNFAYIKETNLDKKEKEIITKICKNARKNNKIDIIGYNTGIKRIKYILKRTLTINDTNALPEGKY